MSTSNKDIPQSSPYYKDFFSTAEYDLCNRFLEQGFVIVQVENLSSLERIRERLVNLACEFLKISVPKDFGQFLNQIAAQVPVEKLNEFRLYLFNNFNAEAWARVAYHSLIQKTLDCLIGNELAMQKRINLSVQLPQDDSSLLPLHSDCWSGDSPFEAVLWLPLVDCYRTKSMYILPPKPNAEFVAKMSEYSTKSAEDLFKAIEPHLIWLEIKYGQALLFSHTLMHGNRVNQEPEARWSMNCRFKSLFSPYWDKRLGEFFEPITTRPLTRVGMNYSLPGGFHE